MPELVREGEVHGDDRAEQPGERHQRQRVVRVVHRPAWIWVQEHEHRREQQEESARDADSAERGELLESEGARVEHRRRC
jgi:hypothetical protein